jgi:hypothetical protein
MESTAPYATTELETSVIRTFLWEIILSDGIPC